MRSIPGSWKRVPARVACQVAPPLMCPRERLLSQFLRQATLTAEQQETPDQPQIFTIHERRERLLVIPQRRPLHAYRHSDDLAAALAPYGRTTPLPGYLAETTTPPLVRPTHTKA